MRIDFAPMSHAHDEHENRRIFDLVQDAIVPDSDTVRIRAALELLRAMQTRIIRECLDLSVDPTRNLSRRTAKIRLRDAVNSTRCSRGNYARPSSARSCV